MQTMRNLFIVLITIKKPTEFQRSINIPDCKYALFVFVVKSLSIVILQVFLLNYYIILHFIKENKFMSFENLDLIEELLMALKDMGFAEPTPIQTDAIPEIINGDRDLVGLAQTGTGKTAAFALPMIQLTDFKSKVTQGVVICPTRELCMQIANDYKNFCKYIKTANIVPVYGGASILDQIKLIKKGAQIIVATPGRLLDLINRRVINLNHIGCVVLDEADEMLNMGFQEDIDAILNKTNKEKHTWLFSATMPKEVARIASKYMNNPVEVTVGGKNRGAENIEHLYYLIKERDRYFALKRVIDLYPEIYGLVFCRTRKETQEVAEKLVKDGYNAEAIHGDLSQQVRDKVMQRFRNKNLQVLIATDVAARGIDIQDITHVINYKLPDEAENYTHRSGRTARAGKSGISIAFINTKEQYRLKNIERKAKIAFKYSKVPDGYSICEKQLYTMINKLVTVDVNQDEIGKFLTPVYKTLEELSKEDLIQKFISLEFNKFLTYYKNSPDLNITSHKKEKSYDKPTKNTKNPKKSGKRQISGKSQRFFMNAGAMDKLRKGAIVRVICEKAGIKADKIGNIEIMREFSFFEVEYSAADKVLNSMKGAKIDGKKISVQYSDKKKAVKKR